MIKIYDIREDKDLQKAIKERSNFFSDSPYIEAYGEYGSFEWWERVADEGLIKEFTCKVVSISGLGKKTDFPTFTVTIDGNNQTFECKGKLTFYEVGNVLRLTLVDKKKVFKETEQDFLLLAVDST